MSNLLAQTVPLAFAAAISPLVLMAVLTLLGGASPKKRALGFTIGVVIGTTVILSGGLVIVELQKGKTSSGPLGSPAFELIAGMLLIALAALMVRPSRSSDEDKARQKHRQWIKPNASIFAFVAFGMALMLFVNFSTTIVLLLILKNVARANAPLGDEIVALALVGFITVLPATAPLCASLFGGPVLTAKVAVLGAWTTRNGTYILAVLFFVFGLQDLLKAFGH